MNILNQTEMVLSSVVQQLKLLPTVDTTSRFLRPTDLNLMHCEIFVLQNKMISLIHCIKLF